MATLNKESNMDMVFTPGEMVNNMMECGKMENNMVKVHSLLQLVKFVKEFGLTE
jgi:hypothetical protein